MSAEVFVRPEAKSEFEEAAQWYESQREHLGLEFLDEVEAVFQLIADNPQIAPVVHGSTRRAMTRRFPFGIYYRIDGDSVIVLAVMHGSRHPRHWKQRSIQ